MGYYAEHLPLATLLGRLFHNPVALSPDEKLGQFEAPTTLIATGQEAMRLARIWFEEACNREPSGKRRALDHKRPRGVETVIFCERFMD
jgi:hypothetical protein